MSKAVNKTSGLTRRGTRYAIELGAKCGSIGDRLVAGVVPAEIRRRLPIAHLPLLEQRDPGRRLARHSARQRERGKIPRSRRGHERIECRGRRISDDCQLDRAVHERVGDAEQVPEGLWVPDQGVQPYRGRG